MKVTTFNVKRVKGRMPRLLGWLEEARPDIACLQEIKPGDATFPHGPIEAAGSQAIWHGMPRHDGVAILSRADRPVEMRRGLPGDDSDGQARYLEADVGGVRIASVYLPNGNPVGSDNSAYKLRWFARFNACAKTLVASGADTLLCGDFKVVPTNNDIFNAGSWRFHSVLQPETARFGTSSSPKDGRTQPGSFIRKSARACTRSTSMTSLSVARPGSGWTFIC